MYRQQEPSSYYNTEFVHTPIQQFPEPAASPMAPDHHNNQLSQPGQVFLGNPHSPEDDRYYENHPMTSLPHRTVSTPYSPHQFPGANYNPATDIPVDKANDSIPPGGIPQNNNAKDMAPYEQNGGPEPVYPTTGREKALGFFRRRQPWVVWIFTLAQVITMIIELTENSRLTGSVIETSPFNIMIGPASTTLIHSGARFVPCMRPGPYSNDPAPCPQNGDMSVTTTADLTCTWDELCGFGGFGNEGIPNQGFRFILPVFLHGGILHLLFNLLGQLSYGSDLEREIGWWRFGAIYLLSGFGGVVFGAMLAPPLVASVGASGALFGLFGCQLLEILFHWKLVKNPGWELAKFTLVMLVCLALGLLPYVDNFAHIGGFLTGIFAGLIFLSNLSLDKYTFRIRIVSWIIAVAVIIILFAVALTTFYNSDDPTKICSWCKYLSCAAIFDSCKQQYNQY
ncbi:hypothetical protein IWQ61_002425 [Dispira simplex]|nr:hypothetical protein IWQ61_002425 [Dispira simplex]